MPERPRRLSHVDLSGKARMVDVAGKPATFREAEAEGRVALGARAFRLVRANRVAKGDVLGVARIAGIQAAKRTSEWIPLCHPVPLENVEIGFRLEPRRKTIVITARAAARWSTGVEMEAMTAVAAAALAIYDMCKGVERAMEIGGIRLLLKRGGRSGEFRRLQREGGGPALTRTSRVASR
ncbi:MAG TPA: cyclic pyranopterin monophosphate synthase MoaC [Candidatus Polarisedimenticolia bacterium]|nr:cyclic pyranopterin monophosphate synthase MoaC [Candidatus Polarisedimenticolia bacterium]